MSELIIATNDTIHEIIEQEIEKLGDNADLNHIDVSQVTDMSALFKYSSFNGDISEWDVSNVRYMNYMFEKSDFNGDIFDWDVSNVREMVAMFYSSSFDNDISLWDVSNVRNMDAMFAFSMFDNDISLWDVSNVKSMRGMFEEAYFDHSIPDWNVSKKTDVSNVFLNATHYNDPERYPKWYKELCKDDSSDLTASNENVNGKIFATNETIKEIITKEIERLGDEADLNHIDVSQVTDMSHLFQDSQFNGDISNWDVSNVESLANTFCSSQFNGDISNWDVSNVEYVLPTVNLDKSLTVRKFRTVQRAAGGGEKALGRPHTPSAHPHPHPI